MMLAFRTSSMWFLLLQFDRLDNVAWKKQLHDPVHRDTDLSLQPRQLRKIDAAPHQPREQARKSDGPISRERDAQFRTGGLMTHDTESSQGIEMKFSERASLDVRANVFCQNLCLAQGKLRRWRARFLSLCINHCSTVAECPQPWPTDHSKGRINDQCTPFILL